MTPMAKKKPSEDRPVMRALSQYWASTSSTHMPEPKSQPQGWKPMTQLIFGVAFPIGIMLLMPSLFNLMLYVLCWWCQIIRLLAEERLLGEDPAYRAFAQTTRWRMLPGVF